MQPFATELREFTDSIWVTTLGFEVSHLDELPAVDVKQHTLVSCVQFTGAWRGGVVMSCPAEVAREVASVMFGVEAADVSVAELGDAMGELANMTGGNLKALLPEPTTLSLPSVTEGTDYSVRIPGTCLVTAIAFEVLGKPVVVSLLRSD